MSGSFLQDEIFTTAKGSFTRETILPTAVGVGGAFLANELVDRPKPKQTQPKKPKPMPAPAPIIIEAPEVPSLPAPPQPQSPGGRTKEETTAMKRERRRLRRASGRASTILVGLDEDEEDEALKGNIKRKSLLGGA